MKIHLFFDDGGELAMTDARRLGRILIRDDPLNEPPIARLGFDPLLDLPGPQAFCKMLQRRSAIIKALLLDQGFAAGVGNWIADEVLYQARIDPRRRAGTLSEAEAKLLRRRLKSVVETAVEVNADSSRYPRTWLFHERWGRRRGAKTAQGEPIEHMTVGGRTTAWVPKVQS
jgi:formamidopyrimidine-DNA glycosylase